MNAHRRRSWTWFLATAGVLLLAMAWLTVSLHSLDRDELAARQQAALHEKLRLALWRMDSWLSPQLAREAMRPAADYRAFPPAGAAWTRGLARLPKDEVVVPSPLLGFRSELFVLHFQLDARGTLSSPQVPTGNERDLAEANGMDPAAIDACAQRLERLRPRLQQHGLDGGLGAAEARLPAVGCNSPPPGASSAAVQSVQEFSNRQMNYAQNVQQSQGELAPAWTADTAPAAAGPLLPFWLDGDQPMLILARRAPDGGGSCLQGVVIDWPALSRALLAQVEDLFVGGGAGLQRCDAPLPEQQASMLATVPARLSAPPPCAAASALPTPAILATTWGAAVLALLALAFTLRQAIGFGERRARFASAVTHELRTPLCTFRMYSEMLADGVVSEPAARQQYLGTLRSEADRLARVVENVLAWSRLEEGRFKGRRERHALGALLQRHLPLLERRLAEAGLTLQFTASAAVAGAVVDTDEDAVLQILFNLVDNAAKYAAGARADGGRPVVELQADGGDGMVQIAVRDHGPGVPPAHRRRIFAPFDRGAVPTASNDVPGVGLGLPLARGLARDLGGDLLLEAPADGGARFVLLLPQA